MDSYAVCLGKGYLNICHHGKVGGRRNLAYGQGEDWKKSGNFTLVDVQQP